LEPRANSSVATRRTIWRRWFGTAVSNKGVDLTPFNHYLMGHNVDYERWLTEGTCRGLAIEYLACVKNGEEFNKVVSTDSMNTFTFADKYKQIRTGLHKEILDAVATKDSDLFGYLKTKARSVGGVQRRGEAAVKKAFEFAAHDGCYSFVSFAHHATAAVGVKKDIKHFMEPNCGIIIGPTQNVLAAMNAFFSHPFVQAIYNMTDENFSFKVKRFK
jgi:hypothetical protein